MTLYNTLQNFSDATNSSDLGTPLYYANSVVPHFVSIVILFPLFMIILLSTYFGVKKSTGRGDIVASLAVASFIDVIVAVLLSLTNPPLVTAGTLITVICIFIASGVLLIITRD